MCFTNIRLNTDWYIGVNKCFLLTNNLKALSVSLYNQLFVVITY